MSQTEITTSKTDSDDSQQPIDKLREILLGKERESITTPVKENAREIVTTVISEALNDRQRQDKSIDKVLAPIIEKVFSYCTRTSIDSSHRQIISAYR